PDSEIPLDIKTNLQNWDCPEAINFLSFHKTLKILRNNNNINDDIKIDLKFFIQADYEILKERRDSRSKYITLEGEKKDRLFTWYIWPNHVKYHKHLYSGEKGIRIEDLNILETNHRDSLINNINKSVMIIIDYIKISIFNKQ
ncbi:14308_t:CDS:2, partial [Entrophospora sp. SA101]